MGRSLLVAVSLALLASALSGCFLSPQGSNARAAPGEWARDFLDDKEYGSLLVEVHYAGDAKPADSAIQRLRSTLASYLSKPEGITVETTGDLPAQSGRKVSLQKVADLEDDHRDEYRGDGRAVLYVAYLDSGYSGDSGDSLVLGAAYRGSSIVIFKDNIRSSVEGSLIPGVTSATAGDVEEAVLIHELGHILGLVDNGIPMVQAHEDAEHPGHSSNRRSVMYYKVESSDIISFLTEGGIPKTFDTDDEADMRDAGGK